jgi:hypothetical protein
MNESDPYIIYSAAPILCFNYVVGLDEFLLDPDAG